MNPTAMERHLETMPEEAVDSMIELSNRERWAVLIALVAARRMGFEEFLAEFGNWSDVVAALDHLVAGGFAARTVDDLADIGVFHKTVYTPTPLADAVVRAVTDAFLPTEPQSTSGQE